MAYRKIDPRIWRDEKFRDFSRDEKLIVFYCLTAQTNRVGIFNFSPAMAAEELDMPLKAFMEAFRKVLKSLRWGYDERLRVLYIPTWWKYNKPENPNVVKGSLKDLKELPKTELLHDFKVNLQYLPETFHKAFHEGFQEVFPKGLPKSVTVTGTVTGTVENNIYEQVDTVNKEKKNINIINNKYNARSCNDISGPPPVLSIPLAGKNVDKFHITEDMVIEWR